MTLTQITEKGIKDGEIINADINTSAAIAGSKIDPSFTSNIHINNDAPKLFLTDGSNNPDFSLQNANGAFVIQDETASAVRMEISDIGHTTISGNLTVNNGYLEVANSNLYIEENITHAGDGDTRIRFPAADAIALETGGNSSLYINSSGQVGIGTTSPDRLIHGAGATPILKLDSTNNEAYVQFKTASPSNETYIGLLDGNIYFSITGTGVTSSVTEKFRVEKTGDVFLPDGNVNLVSGHGIHFHNYGTGTNISSNLLDDYEEGTYTPTDSSGANLSLTQNTTARYTKIGRLINVQFDISWPSNSSATAAAISLPFSGSILYGSGTVGWTDIGKPLQIHISTSAAIMDNDSPEKHAFNSELSGKRAIGSFNYIVS